MLVVADFDNYFYSVRSPDHISRMISEDRFAHIFTWETTTSYDASAQIPENELKPESVLLMSEREQRPKYIRIQFSDRSCLNKFLFIVFRLLNLAYTTFYYYFMPWLESIYVFFLILNQNKEQAGKAFENASSMSS